MSDLIKIIKYTKGVEKMFELDQISNELSAYNDKLEEMGNLL